MEQLLTFTLAFFLFVIFIVLFIEFKREHAKSRRGENTSSKQNKKYPSK